MNNNKLSVYIDSNIWLDLYHFSNNDLEEFKKFKDSQVKILLPEQTKNEVYRNRVIKINDARKQFEKINFNYNIPNVYKEFNEYKEEFYSLNNLLHTKFSEWKEKVSKSIVNETLLADIIISDLFETAESLDSEKYYDVAVKRMNIGNPPGKDRSYGDAINWETLLGEIPESTDLYMITGDKDYYDDKKNEIVNSFLKKEWNSKNKGNIFVYNSLASFFEEHISNIKMQQETLKRKAIDKLINSFSFFQTHSAISDLTTFLGTFSDEEKKELVTAAKFNSQVSDIFIDDDIKEFYYLLLDKSIYEVNDDLYFKIIHDFLEGDSLNN